MKWVGIALVTAVLVLSALRWHDQRKHAVRLSAQPVASQWALFWAMAKDLARSSSQPIRFSIGPRDRHRGQARLRPKSLRGVGTKSGCVGPPTHQGKRRSFPYPLGGGPYHVVRGRDHHHQPKRTPDLHGRRRRPCDHPRSGRPPPPREPRWRSRQLVFPKEACAMRCEASFEAFRGHLWTVGNSCAPCAP